MLPRPMRSLELLGSLVLSTALLACTSGSPAGGDAGILTTGNGQWTQLNSGLPDSDVVALASQGTKLYALTSGASANFYLSSDAAASWTHATGDLMVPGTSDTAISAFALSGTAIVAGAGLLFDSANDGQHWTVVNDTAGNPVVYTMVRVFGSDVFVGPVGGMLVSHDGGATWATAQVNDSTGNSSPWVDGVPQTMASVGGHYLVGVGLGKSVWTSSDAGDHWVTSNAGLPPGAGGAGGASITAFGVHGSVVFAGAGASGIYKSTDGGTSWSASSSGFYNASNPLGPTTAYAFSVNGSSVYAGTDSGVYVSTNDGASWSTLDRGDLPDFTAVYSMTVMGANLYIGTYTTGVWRHAL